ncbi:MAG: F0F1 ATP synthase subunit gamma, partial [Phycisphaerales bacterium]|nr:F0F1 ATP synthase subunit gamma [Phycisphaerales bacterium]
MPNPRKLKKRIKAVANIKRITKTMQMIATSKYAKALAKATSSKPFTEGVFELVTELASKAGNLEHPLIQGPAGGVRGKDLVLVLTSDRGLCGPYNGGVLRAAVKLLREAGANLEIELVGRKGLAALKFLRFPIARHHTQFGDNPQYAAVEALAQQYMDRFITGEIASVRVVYMRFISTARQRPEIVQLLPLKAPKKADAPASGGGGGVGGGGG